MCVCVYLVRLSNSFRAVHGVCMRMHDCFDANLLVFLCLRSLLQMQHQWYFLVLTLSGMQAMYQRSLGNVTMMNDRFRVHEQNDVNMVDMDSSNDSFEMCFLTTGFL